jgi:agmatine deiminase
MSVGNERDTPAGHGFAMPPEWFPHERTWMSFPPDDDYDGSHHETPMIEAWAATANAIVDFEPVSMLVPPHRARDAARLLDRRVEQVECELDDCWLRDNGPTFLLNAEGDLGAALWTFNGWGRNFSDQTGLDARAGRLVAEHVDAHIFTSALVNEGGGIHVDGQGTVLVTESVQLDPHRNPDWTKADVEAELRAMLGVSKVIWLTQGLTLDMDRRAFGTNGHVDIVAFFAAPGVVAVHSQGNPDHPDAVVMAEQLEILRMSTDAHGRPFEIVEMPAPTNGWHDDGSLCDESYINFVMVNHGLVLCSFDDPIADERAHSVFARLFPQRTITSVPASAVFARGGGLHCITQQQPARLAFSIT